MIVVWSHAARRDLLRIFDFNVRRNEDHALRIDERLEQAGARIARNPRIGRPVADAINVRERSLPEIQYVVRYRIEDDQAITILQVRHTRESRERP